MVVRLLIVRAPSQRAAEFDEFARAGHDRWLRFAYALCGDWHRAQDVVQEVLTRLYVRWPRAQRLGHPEAYVRRAIVNALHDERRRPFRRHEHQNLDQAPELADLAASSVEEGLGNRDSLIGALAQIPHGQRTVLVLRFVEDLDVAATARVLGCSTGNVKSQTARGLAALRRHLSNCEESRR